MNFLKGLIKFVTSKAFLIQLVIAITALVILCFITLEWLESSTNHDQRIVVPSLSKKTLAEVNELLEAKDLRYEVQDSANYNPDFPKFSVVDQNPKPGSEVKENRKIYITINPSGYGKVDIPKNVIFKTRRQVEPKLVALGFKIGSVITIPHSSDQVLELRHKGQKVNPGDKLTKTSVIDLVIGDGGGLRLPPGNNDTN